MNNKCEVCNYLEKYDSNIALYINEIIFKGAEYEEIKKDCKTLPFPEEKYVKKHRLECLKDFVSKNSNVNIDDNNSLNCSANSNQNSFSFKDHGDKDGETRITNLKKEWLSISEKLTQIVSYNVSKYHPDKIASSENIKETVANLKTITDLARADFTFELLNDEENVLDYLNDDEIQILNTLKETARKHQQELKKRD